MKKPRILVVDDEESLLSLLEAYLTQEGFCVATARNGREALRLCRQVQHGVRREIADRAREHVVIADVGDRGRAQFADACRGVERIGAFRRQRIALHLRAADAGTVCVHCVYDTDPPSVADNAAILDPLRKAADR